MTVRAEYELLETGSTDRLGEGPWWSVAEQRLYWVDILGRRVRTSGLDGSDAREWATPTEVGFAIPVQDGRHAVVGLSDGVFRLDLASGAITPLGGNGMDGVDALDGLTPELRINDGKTDRRGRVWFGSMHRIETEPLASLYRLDAAGVSRIRSGITTSNGTGWSPDGTVMYYTDSMAKTITMFDYDQATGELSRERPFVTEAGDYFPDGLTVDADGCVWSAKWGGGKVVRYAPDGRVVAEIGLPVLRPTSCMFVGADLRTLAVTSANVDVGATNANGLAGSVFLLDPGVAGLAEVPAAL